MTRDELIETALSVTDQPWLVSLAEVEAVFPLTEGGGLSAVEFLNNILMARGDVRAELDPSGAVRIFRPNR